MSRGRRALAAAALIVSPVLAAAQTLPPVLVADELLAHLAAAAPLPRGMTTEWRLEAGEAVPSVACAGDQGIAGRLLLTTRPLTPREVRRCATLGRAEPLTAAIGWEAVFVVAKAMEWAGLQSAQLHRALAASVPAGPDGVPVANQDRRWRDVSRDLPDADIRVLMPAPGTSLNELFARAVLEPGCLAAPAARPIFARDERVHACTTLRSDGPVSLAQPGTDPLAWLAEQPPYALAVVSQAEVSRLGDDLVVLPLDGVVPTYTAVTSGAYAASWTVYLTLVAAAPGDPAIDAAVALTAEGGMGPSGTLAAAGLTPLPAAERVALRAHLFAIGGS